MKKYSLILIALVSFFTSAYALGTYVRNDEPANPPTIEDEIEIKSTAGVNPLSLPVGRQAHARLWSNRQLEFTFANIGNVELSILDVDGMAVYQNAFNTANVSSLWIDLNNWDPGTYTIKVMPFGSILQGVFSLQ